MERPAGFAAKPEHISLFAGVTGKYPELFSILQESQRATGAATMKPLSRILSLLTRANAATAKPAALPRPGHVAFVGAGPGDAGLLTVKALNALQSADVVIHDRLVSAEILALAGRGTALIDVGKQGFGTSTAQSEINALIVHHAARGSQVVRLKGGDPSVFGRLDEEIDACDAAGIGWHVVPGITAASASAAAIGQSLTKRGRNSSLRLLTGHDMQGFADHDWRALARPGEVAAIYMGKASARFVQGRLIMHGADRATPVTLVENASRPDQRILATTLERLPADLAAWQASGPALTLFGLAPRDAATALTEIEQKQELA
ncbi:uroporphyrinogen-III C-methyltransferase [Roseovarius faecimaris]|uniref:uroporphyrinogen-III C-methyltransferase n=1 Tax=Roseovarius faecimaris TaxID=2494550 RepID=A0A6I6IPP3_9RHOB|nr:uroporphyrinogen-III C-methyltransferase [Roseovarius faecimaris]